MSAGGVPELKARLQQVSAAVSAGLCLEAPDHGLMASGGAEAREAFIIFQGAEPEPPRWAPVLWKESRRAEFKSLVIEAPAGRK